jgi:hypothetical protein
VVENGLSMQGANPCPPYHLGLREEIMRKEDIRKHMRFEALSSTISWKRGDRGTVVKVDPGWSASRVEFDHHRNNALMYIPWEDMARIKPTTIDDVEVGMEVWMIKDMLYMKKHDIAKIVAIDDDDTCLLAPKNGGPVCWTSPNRFEIIKPATPERLKRTEIDYVTLPDGRVKIIEIRNASWLEEIREKHGKVVSYDYFHGYPKYWSPGGKNKKVLVRVDLRDDHAQVITVGEVYTKVYFDFITNTMKTAGNRLGKLIHANLERKEEKAQIRKVKTIKI